MKNLNRYVKDLTARVKVNEKALKISEKGAKMEQKKYSGYHIPVLKTYKNDVILKIETDGVDMGSKIISVGIVDENGLILITRDDPKFEQKIGKELSILNDKKVFMYHRDFTMMFLKRYVQGISFEVIDLRDEMGKLFSSSPMGIKDSIEIPWDPIEPGEVPERWMIRDFDAVKTHAIAECVRLHFFYTLYILQSYISPRAIPQSSIRCVFTKIKLPPPVGIP